ncbi:MAG: toll/interleukin-1 receptor domain-containing protein [Candidatus Nanopelagicales bacterium]
MDTQELDLTGSDVFLSYAHLDGSDAAEAIVDFLRGLGYSCWWDREGLKPGDYYDRIVLPAISAAKYFLLLATPAALESREVQDEVSHSVDTHKDQRSWIAYGIDTEHGVTSIHKNLINRGQGVTADAVPADAARAAWDCVQHAFSDDRKNDLAHAKVEIGRLLSRHLQAPSDERVFEELVEWGARAKLASWGVKSKEWDTDKIFSFFHSGPSGDAAYQLLLPDVDGKFWVPFVCRVLDPSEALVKQYQPEDLSKLLWDSLDKKQRSALKSGAKSGASPRLRYLYTTVRTLDSEASLVKTFSTGFDGSRLSPIVGASTTAFAASSQPVRIDDSVRTRHVALPVKTKSPKVGRDSPDDCVQGRAVELLKGLSQRGDGLSTFLNGVLEAAAAGRVIVETASGDRLVSELRGALLAMAFFANDMFIGAQVNQGTPIKEWSGTPVAVTVEDAAHFAAILAKARKAAAELQTRSKNPWASQNDEALRLLGLPAILRHLRDWADRFPDPTGPPPEGSPSGGPSVIDQQEVIWLADLFWHSLSFRAPGYPTPDDLEFQVALVHESLAHQTGPHRRSSRGRQISATRSAEMVAESLAICLERGLLPAPQSPQQPLYAAIAESLVAQRRADEGAVPIAVDCAFDMELERAIARGGSPFHVAFPIVLQPSGGWEWVVADFDGFAEGFEQPEDLRNVRPGYVRRFSQWGRDKVNGPLLIRLNGAPMLRPFSPRLIPEGGDFDFSEIPGGRDEGPMVVIPAAFGEFDAMAFLHMDLQSFGTESDKDDSIGWPEWVRIGIGDKSRMWISVGMGMEDWNNRMQVFIHATRASIIGAQSGNARSFSVAEGHGDDLVGFLTACSVKPLSGNAPQLGEILRDYADSLGRHANGVAK